MSSESSNTQSESGQRHILCPAEVRGTSHGPRASKINTQEPVLGFVYEHERVCANTTDTHKYITMQGTDISHDFSSKK